MFGVMKLRVVSLFKMAHNEWLCEVLRNEKFYKTSVGSQKKIKDEKDKI